MAERTRIKVKGIVQGVGFRPFVYTLAESLHLKGYVTNTSDGVMIEVEGKRIPEFIERLPKEAPPLSQIVDVTVAVLPARGYADFRITESRNDDSYRPFTLVSPDVSICDDCLTELFERQNRRYLYPFINCTNCGPRYTITRSVPYDRPNTTMAVFQMCSECSEEYNNPKDRRFHAQPNACPKCGPRVELRVKDKKSKVETEGDPVKETIKLLKEGAIVAIKGLGGFHIACDAENREAVKRLRERKRRSNKPFALMAPDIESIKGLCEVSEEEERLLLLNRRPIVLLKKRDDVARFLAEAVSPNNRYLGFMLPYTPLHYLLFNNTGEGSLPPVAYLFKALVMTSGNMSEEPIVKDNEEAIIKLSGLADAFLFHNRDIFMRVDDSVVRVMEDHTHHSSLSFIRRSRGYVPGAIPLHSDGPDVMGCGADLKNTFTITKGSFAIPSQHIGDMENYETLRFFEECVENMKGIYRANPVALGHDIHPGYLSTQWALRQGTEIEGERTRTYGIQHHYAHIGSVMAENGLRSKVIGVAFDGTGYGTDGNSWGGEFLVADIGGFDRAGHFRYIPLPGGEAAIREPWRTAISYVIDAAGDEAMDYLDAVGFIGRYGKDSIGRLMKVSRAAELSPLSSGAGRLFDAVSALIGLCDRNTFEGEAAIALESLVRDGIDEEYPVNIVAEKTILVDFSQTFLGIMNDLAGGAKKHVISTKFHNTVASVILKVVTRIGEIRMLRDVVLSGGTFQNMYLLRRVVELLAYDGMNVFVNKAVPCNDACISLGQAYLVREKIKDHHG